MSYFSGDFHLFQETSDRYSRSNFCIPHFQSIFHILPSFISSSHLQHMLDKGLLMYTICYFGAFLAIWKIHANGIIYKIKSLLTSSHRFYHLSLYNWTFYSSNVFIDLVNDVSVHRYLISPVLLYVGHCKHNLFRNKIVLQQSLKIESVHPECRRHPCINY